MKNLEQSGLVALDAAEMQEVQGGWFFLGFAAGLLAAKIIDKVIEEVVD